MPNKPAERSTRPRLDEEESQVNIIYYGTPKQGKTTALAGLARMGRVIYIDAESGLKRRPLESIPRPIPTGNIEPFRDITFDSLLELCDQIRYELSEDPTCIAGVVWDSVTETQKIFLEQLALANVEKALAMRMEKDPFQITKDMYTKNNDQMRRLIRRFRDLPTNAGLAAAERWDDDLKRGGPAVTPSLSQSLQGYMDIICYCQTVTIGERDFYIGRFRPFDRFAAGDRFNCMPRVLNEPSFDRVIEYVKGSLTVESDELQQEYATARDEAMKANITEENHNG